MSGAEPWEIRFSNSRKRPYFYNSATQESRWEVPDSLANSDVSSLPGAEFLSYSQQPAKPQAASSAAGGGGSSNKVRASHLLVKHAGSRRPSSWRDDNITRSKEDAIDRVKAFERQLNDSPDLAQTFAQIASKESDCSSARDGGDLGYFGRNQMQKPFEEASFALEVGQLSDIVSTDSGVHLILRTA
ncbi:hypothetical protein JCM9279_004214 [Rhodotorula babjevae]